jgi:hypothetical protein
VDWVRISPYTTSCTFTSRVIDAGQRVSWQKLVWSAETPAGTTLAMTYRIGNTATPDGTWTAWAPVSTSDGALAGSSRCLQYAAQMGTSDTTQTPVLTDVTVTHVVCSPPAIACVGNVVANTSGASGQVVTGIAPVSQSADCGIQSVSWTAPGATPASGSDDASGTLFPLGVTTVTYTITDTPGNVASCSFTVTVDRPPTCPDSDAGVTENHTLVLSIGKLLRLASDPDPGDTLSVTAAGPTSALGRTVSLPGNGTITYAAGAASSGTTDSFTYTISDNHGGKITPIVHVTVASSGVPSPNIIIPPDTLPNGHFHVGFAGIPGYRYTVQYSPNPTGPWTNMTTLTAGTDGLFEFEDPTEPAPSSRYYRTIYP